MHPTAHNKAVGGSCILSFDACGIIFARRLFEGPRIIISDDGIAELITQEAAKRKPAVSRA